MLIQVYVKNEPVQNCDLLIAREDAVVSVPVKDLQALQENRMEVRLVKAQENMAMKAAVLATEAIASAESMSSPVFVACADKAILEGICSMEYTGPAGGTIQCVPSGTKPQAPPRARNRAKPKTPGQAAADARQSQEGTAGAPDKPAGTEPGGQDGAPAEPAAGQGGTPPGPGAEESRDEGVLDAMSDPSLVKNGEVNLGSDGQETENSGAPDPTLENTRKIMSILKDKGVPSGQIPGVLEALREAMDADITLPMQVRLKLARDGATGDMDPDATAKLVAPAFDELKTLLKEIDDHNAGK